MPNSKISFRIMQLNISFLITITINPRHTFLLRELISKKIYRLTKNSKRCDLAPSLSYVLVVVMCLLRHQYYFCIISETQLNFRKTLSNYNKIKSFPEQNFFTDFFKVCIPEPKMISLP